MRRYIQLRDGQAVAELETEERIVREGFVDVTARVDGPWLGKIYDAEADTFTAPPAPVDARPFAHILLYDPTASPRAMKTTFMVAEQIGIDVTIKDAQGNTIRDFSGQFGIPIMPWNPVTLSFEGPVRRLGLNFVNGFASRTFSGFDSSGDYGVDDRVSNLARVAEPIIVTVIE